MMSSLQQLVSRCLASEGAIVEPLEPEGLEVLAPANVQKALEIDEWCRLGFGPRLPPRARRVSLESDWPERLQRLLGERGRSVALSLAGRCGAIPLTRADQAVQQALSLENATYRASPAVEAETVYLLLSFRITALSDEKREDLIHLGLNESNGAFADRLPDGIPSFLRSLAELPTALPLPSGLPPSPASDRLYAWVCQALPPRVQARLDPFLAGMTRRMKRDLDCLQAYYAKLQAEIVSHAPPERTSGGSAGELEAIRLAAVGREYRAKVEDLQRKYTTQVEIRLAQALRLAAPVGRIRLDIRRRKGSRSILLDWNPLTRQLDSLPCEACRGATATHQVCDEALHLLCAACLSPCSSCQKRFCRACRPKGCGKCRRVAIGPAGP